MKTALAGLLLAASTILLISIVGILMKQTVSGNRRGLKAINDLKEVSTALTDIDLEMIRGATLTGREVRMFVRKLAKQTVVMITTKAVPAGFYDLSHIADEKNATYVNPTFEFTGGILYDVNDNVLGVSFTQTGVMRAAFDPDAIEKLPDLAKLENDVADKQFKIKAIASSVNRLRRSLALFQQKKEALLFELESNNKEQSENMQNLTELVDGETIHLHALERQERDMQTILEDLNVRIEALKNKLK